MKNRTALITGACGGLGPAVVERLCRGGDLKRLDASIAIARASGERVDEWNQPGVK